MDLQKICYCLDRFWLSNSGSTNQNATAQPMVYKNRGKPSILPFFKNQNSEYI